MLLQVVKTSACTAERLLPGRALRYGEPACRFQVAVAFRRHTPGISQPSLIWAKPETSVEARDFGQTPKQNSLPGSHKGHMGFSMCKMKYDIHTGP